MLAAHYAAPGRLQTMRQLASAAGFEGWRPANLAYGDIGHRVAAHVHLSNPGNWTQLLAEAAAHSAADGEFGWVMREPLARALEELDWVEPVQSLSAARMAEAELAEEPEFARLPETTRRALVNARIGQGGFRARMARLWEGRCAVTGCGIGEVLVASHAKSWKHSSNDERLDEFNGLFLQATLDRLFDRGLIGFADDGRVVKGSTLRWDELAVLNVGPGTQLRTVHARNVPFLRQHRAEHGLGSDPSSFD